jgi:hypothetical protein
MNGPQTPYGEGFPPGEDPDLLAIGVPEPPRRRPRRAAPLAGVAALALVGGAGVAYAATHTAPARAAVTAAVSSSPTASPSPPPRPSAGWPAGHRGRFGGFAFGGFGMGRGGLVHGQFTEPKSGGGYQTVDVQNGTVSAVSANSVTVKSADGFTATYTVTSSTVVDAKAAGIGSVKKGDTIFVAATVSGRTATAANITDLTAVQAGRASFGFPPKPPAPAAQAPAQLSAAAVIVGGDWRPQAPPAPPRGPQAGSKGRKLRSSF